MCIGHDLHRSFGWLIPFGLYFEPRIIRQLGMRLIPSNAEESLQNKQRHDNFLNNRFYTVWQPYENKFLSMVGSYLTDTHMRIESGCIAVYQHDIALRLFPDLFT